MATSSPSASRTIVAGQQPAWKWVDAVGRFLVRRRILLSAIVFVLVVGKNMASGLRPHDLVNLADPYTVAGLVLVFAGLALRSWAVGILRKDKELTTTGPYSLIRNPLYVGSFMMMFGFCALLDNPRDLWLILGPVALLYVVKVRQEERLLAVLFPEQWPDYSKRTPRFLPFSWKVKFASDWRGTQWMRSREYQAVGASVAALVAIKLWQTYG